MSKKYLYCIFFLKRRTVKSSLILEQFQQAISMGGGKVVMAHHNSVGNFGQL